jgi:hypothetical protein
MLGGHLDSLNIVRRGSHLNVLFYLESSIMLLQERGGWYVLIPISWGQKVRPLLSPHRSVGGPTNASVGGPATLYWHPGWRGGRSHYSHPAPGGLWITEYRYNSWLSSSLPLLWPCGKRSHFLIVGWSGSPVTSYCLCWHEEFRLITAQQVKVWVCLITAWQAWSCGLHIWPFWDEARVGWGINFLHGVCLE